MTKPDQHGTMPVSRLTLTSCSPPQQSVGVASSDGRRASLHATCQRSIEVQRYAFVKKEVNRTHRHVALQPCVAQ
jgi:hypothetical protein